MRCRSDACYGVSFGAARRGNSSPRHGSCWLTWQGRAPARHGARQRFGHAVPPASPVALRPFAPAFGALALFGLVPVPGGNPGHLFHPDDAMMTSADLVVPPISRTAA
jgi:hypothetical protein